MSQVHPIDHPLIASKLTAMRRCDTSSAEFRRLLREITVLLGYEATRDLPVRLEPVATPMATAELPVLQDDPLVIVPILRAGIGMVDGMLDLLPMAQVGHIGLARDEATHLPQEYYCKLPFGVQGAQVIVVDPMLATGGSAIDAVASLKARGCQRIRMVNLLAAPEGLEAFGTAHPDVEVFVAAIDQGLDENAYILPGLGDAGDRIFGTC